jgi:hypothetical protein
LWLRVHEQEPIKSDDQYLDMPIGVFRRTLEKQVEKDVHALKELTSRPAVQVPEEQAPTELPPSLAAILGTHRTPHAHTTHRTHTLASGEHNIDVGVLFVITARAEAMTPKRADGTSDLSMLRKKLGTFCWLAPPAARQCRQLTIRRVSPTEEQAALLENQEKLVSLALNTVAHPDDSPSQVGPSSTPLCGCVRVSCVSCG